MDALLLALLIEFAGWIDDGDGSVYPLVTSAQDASPVDIELVESFFPFSRGGKVKEARDFLRSVCSFSPLQTLHEFLKKIFTLPHEEVFPFVSSLIRDLLSQCSLKESLSPACNPLEESRFALSLAESRVLLLVRLMISEFESSTDLSSEDENKSTESVSTLLTLFSALNMLSLLPYPPPSLLTALLPHLISFLELLSLSPRFRNSLVPFDSLNADCQLVTVLSHLIGVFSSSLMCLSPFPYLDEIDERGKNEESENYDEQSDEEKVVPPRFENERRAISLLSLPLCEGGIHQRHLISLLPSFLPRYLKEIFFPLDEKETTKDRLGMNKSGKTFVDDFIDDVKSGVRKGGLPFLHFLLSDFVGEFFSLLENHRNPLRPPTLSSHLLRAERAFLSSLLHHFPRPLANSAIALTESLATLEREEEEGDVENGEESESEEAAGGAIPTSALESNEGESEKENHHLRENERYDTIESAWSEDDRGETSASFTPSSHVRKGSPSNTEESSTQMWLRSLRSPLRNSSSNHQTGRKNDKREGKKDDKEEKKKENDPSLHILPHLAVIGQVLDDFGRGLVLLYQSLRSSRSKEEDEPQITMKMIVLSFLPPLSSSSPHSSGRSMPRSPSIIFSLSPSSCPIDIILLSRF